MNRFLLAVWAAVVLAPGTPGQEVSLTFKLPDGREQHGRAACQTDWIMGGKFLRQQHMSTFMGQPLRIWQLLGYDDQKRKFIEFQLPVGGGAPTQTRRLGEAFPDAGRVLTLAGDSCDSVTGNPVLLRTATTPVDQKRYILEEWFTVERGAKEELKVVLTHTRKPRDSRLDRPSTKCPPTGHRWMLAVNPEELMTQQQSTGSYVLDVAMAVPPARVWQALTSESPAWWPRDFYTSTRTQRFVIEPVLGGRAHEDFGGGDGLLWYTVIGLETGRELILAGHLLPPFGGPAVTALRLTLSAQSSGTLLRVQDDRFGALGGESPLDGWRLVFDAGLRQYVESGRQPA